MFIHMSFLILFNDHQIALNTVSPLLEDYAQNHDTEL